MIHMNTEETSVRWPQEKENPPMSELSIDIAHIINTSRKDGFLAVTLFEEKEKVDIAYRILNLSSQLLQNGTDSYCRGLTLETEIRRFLQHHTCSGGIRKKVLLI